MYTFKNTTRYKTELAAGYIVFCNVSRYFMKCRFSSLMLRKMHLHFSEMPAKKRAFIMGKIKRALSGCMTDGLQDLYAEVHTLQSPKGLRIIFTTCGFGDLVADITTDGEVRIERYLS